MIHDAVTQASIHSVLVWNSGSLQGIIYSDLHPSRKQGRNGQRVSREDRGLYIGRVRHGNAAITPAIMYYLVVEEFYQESITAFTSGFACLSAAASFIPDSEDSEGRG